MRKIILLICLIVSLQSFSQGVGYKVFKAGNVEYYQFSPPTNYSFINGRYRWLATMADSGMHIPSYNGTPVGMRTNVWPWDGAIAMDTTNHRLYIFSGNAWVRVANFSEVGSTYTANLPIRITGTVFSADTSYAFTPSLATNARLQKIIDSLNAAGGFGTPTLQQVVTAGNTITNGSAVTTFNTFGDIDIDNRGIGSGIKFRRGDLANTPQASMYYAGSLSSTVFEVGNTSGSTSRFYVNHIANSDNNHFRFPTTVNGSLLDTLASLQDIRNGGGGSDTHFGNTNLTQAANRTYAGAGFNYTFNNLGTWTYNLAGGSYRQYTPTNFNGYIGNPVTSSNTSYTFSTEPDNSYIIFPLSDSLYYLSVEMRKTEGAFLVAKKMDNYNETGIESWLHVKEDSIELKPSAGAINIDSLRTAFGDTTTWKPVVWSPNNKGLKKFNSWAESGLGGGGAVSTDPELGNWLQYHTATTSTMLPTGTGTGNQIIGITLASGNQPDGWIKGIQMTPGTTSTGRSNYYYDASGNYSPIVLTDSMRFTAYQSFRLRQLSDGTNRFETVGGFLDDVTTSSGNVDAVGWRYTDTDSSGHLIYFTKSNSTLSERSTGVPIVANARYQIVVSVYLGVAYCWVKVNGGAWISAPNITTNIPTGIARVTSFGNGINKLLGTDLVYLDIENLAFGKYYK